MSCDMSLKMNPRLALLAAHIFVVSAGCQEGSPPVLQDPGDQVAVVGQTLAVNLIASDPDGGDLSFSFNASIEGISAHAAVRGTPDGQGIFEYTPVAGHEGAHIFDFIASDGDFNTRLPISVEVRGSSGRDGAPVFRSPQAGIAIDADEECGSFDVVVEDVDSLEIELTEVGEPLSGATLDVGPDGKTATWRWCPSAQQRALGSPAVTLSADDGDNPPTLKEVLVHLQRDAGENCPGDAAVIEHDPQDIETAGPVVITAVISDDQGPLEAPRVLYKVGDGEASEEMTLIDGGDLTGTWQAELPNPTAGAEDGATAPLQYRIEATDKDNPAPDPLDSCHHTTSDPSTGLHEVRITRGGDGGGDGAKPCATCTDDDTCGGARDLCIELDGESGRVCGAACNTTDLPCGEGFECSDSVEVGTNGTAERQCLPVAGSCTPPDPPAGCQDDEWDSGDNNDDTPAQADNTPINGSASYQANQVLCPGDDDYFAIVLNNPGHIDFFIDGDYPPDMDIALLGNGGGELEASIEDASTEVIYSECLEPGTYYGLVYLGAGPHEAAADYNVSIYVDEC